MALSLSETHRYCNPAKEFEQKFAKIAKRDLPGQNAQVSNEETGEIADIPAIISQDMPP